MRPGGLLTLSPPACWAPARPRHPLHRTCHPLSRMKPAGSVNDVALDAFDLDRMKQVSGWMEPGARDCLRSLWGGESRCLSPAPSIASTKHAPAHRGALSLPLGLSPPECAGRVGGSRAGQVSSVPCTCYPSPGSGVGEGEGCGSAGGQEARAPLESSAHQGQLSCLLPVPQSEAVLPTGDP